MQIKTEFLVAALVLSSYHTKTSSVTPRAVSETDHDHGRSLRQTYSTAHEVGWMESKLATVTEKFIHLKEELSRTQKKIEPTQLKEGKEKLNQVKKKLISSEEEVRVYNLIAAVVESKKMHDGILMTFLFDNISSHNIYKILNLDLPETRTNKFMAVYVRYVELEDDKSFKLYSSGKQEIKVDPKETSDELNVKVEVWILRQRPIVYVRKVLDLDMRSRKGIAKSPNFPFYIEFLWQTEHHEYNWYKKRTTSNEDESSQVATDLDNT